MLIVRLLESSGFDPSYLIGSPSSESNRSNKLGSGIDFVSEACEYDGSFLDFSTKIAIITNIEEEHLDYFTRGLPQIIDEFSKFVAGIQPGGALIYCKDDKNVGKVLTNAKDYLIENRISLISYGFSRESDILVSNYKVENGFSTFKLNEVEFKSEKIGEFFALNCAAMYAFSKYLGIGAQKSIETVFDFKGAARRNEFLGEKDGVKVYDDYAHHPTEIRVTLQALNEKFPKNRKFVIFEPHQQKRFNDFYEDFYKVFSDNNIDVIALLPVYEVPGRDEKAVKSVSDLIQKTNSKKIIGLSDYREAANFLEENLKNGDILLTMGATDIYKVGQDYLKS
jgi:UDP-N-acetylmuramate--alanine ligase